MPIKKLDDRLHLLQGSNDGNRPLSPLRIDTVADTLLKAVPERCSSDLEVDLPGVAGPNRPYESFICHFL
ncbi:hypothetical protein J2785_003468 [Burkholderia ambifaria]|nr:hypothetical protein [Burkholderia ambifaria]MDR6500312.1 hypothetical protein [Burkholderia ambifaria]